MLLSYNALRDLVERGVIENVPPENINGASIDLTLGDSVMIESWATSSVDLAVKETPNMTSLPLTREGFWTLMPGAFVLANTREVFNLPSTIAAEYKLKSSLARAGLQHLLAGWCDPGWHGSTLTLELCNVLKSHPLRLRPGMKIGQIVLWSCCEVPADVSYAVRGRYNGQTAAQPSKGVE